MGKVSKKPLLSPKKKIGGASQHKKSETFLKSKRVNVTKTGAEDKITLLHKTIAPKKTITKKEKFKQKHKNLMSKFALLKKQRKEEIAKKNREKTAVIGDLKPLKDALPSLDELFKLSKEGAAKTGVKEFDEEPKKLNVKQKIKRKRNKFIRKVNAFQSLLNDPDFKKNPRDLIAYHVKYTHGLPTD